MGTKRQAIALVKDHEVLKDPVSKIEFHGQEAKEKAEFIYKITKDAEKYFAQKDKEAKESLIKYLVESGLMPADYDPKKHHFHLDDGVCTMCETETTGKDIMDILKGILT